MIHARIPVSRTADGHWQSQSGTVQVSLDRRVPLPKMPPEATVADVVETAMGEALLCLDKYRRGTTEPIAWEITVEGVPYCYRCLEPLQPTASRTSQPGTAPDGQWRCPRCGQTFELGDDDTVT